MCVLQCDTECRKEQIRTFAWVDVCLCVCMYIYHPSLAGRHTITLDTAKIWREEKVKLIKDV